jgi:uncharacterized glyoxalase superfamily protein PhnB
MRRARSTGCARCSALRPTSSFRAKTAPSSTTIYLTVDNADQVYARVKAAGAQILIDIEDADYGGRGFTCCDLEGHAWSIGTDDPWQEQPA